MHKVIFLLAIFGMYRCCYAMDDGNYSYFNEEERIFQVALRTYKKENITVHLLGMSHFAQPQFYEFVKEFAQGKIVVYEMRGCDYEQKLLQTKALKQLGQSYQQQYLDIRRLQNGYELAAYAFSLMSANDSDYLSSAHEHIHADLTANKKISSAYETQEQLMKFIEHVASGFLREHKNHENPGAKLHELVKERASLMTSLESFIVKSRSRNNSMPKSDERENIAIKCMQTLFNRRSLNREIFVLYGADHQPVFAKFLIEEGFSLHQTLWNTVFSW